MAKSRSLPTQLYWDPQFSDLGSDAQSIYIGITLDADDHGRGLAWPSRLSRVFNKEVSVITTALDHLEAIGFISRYEVEGVPYYHHSQWDKWQRLDNRARSQFPAPPKLEEDTPEHESEILRDSPRTTANLGESPLEVEVEGGRGKKNLTPPLGDGGLRSTNITPFPIHNSGGGSVEEMDEKRVTEVTQEVATILRLPNDAALRRVVADFASDEHMSLLGEADMARAYIDDTRRNRRGKSMTAAFYRQWLKRERDHLRTKETERSQLPQATGTHQSAPSSGLSGQSLMGLVAQYRGQTSKPKANSHATKEKPS